MGEANRVVGHRGWVAEVHHDGSYVVDARPRPPGPARPDAVGTAGTPPTWQAGCSCGWLGGTRCATDEAVHAGVAAWAEWEQHARVTSAHEADGVVEVAFTGTAAPPRVWRAAG